MFHNPRGRVLGTVFHRAAAAAKAQPSSPPSLTYNGGPVMQSNTTHAIFWEPPGYSFSDADPAYMSIVDGFLGDVAAASGAGDNVYSVSTQYNAPYDSHFAGPITPHDPLPVSGCNGGDGEPCLTDSQLRSEIARVVSANHLPTGLGDMYLLYTPPGVDSCIDSSPGDCSNSTSGFCGYHDYISTAPTDDGDILYANLPYPTTGCDTGQRTTGDPAADDILSTTSHEQNETITDPLGTGWWARSDGEEEGDLCNFNYGDAGYGPDPVEHNQTINGTPYYVQLEWSNWDSGCVASYPLHFSASPRSAATNQSLSFSASETYTSYEWDFGDGSTDTRTCSSPAKCNTETHSYSAPGLYKVKLTANGSAQVTQTIDVGAPSCQSPEDATLPSASAGPVPIQLSCTGNGLKFEIVGGGPAHGTLGPIDSSQSVTYTPKPGFAGNDQFEYEATDSSGAFGAGEVTIAVGGAPDNHVPPAITGNAFEGQLLHATVGWWTATGTISYSYDWQRCDAAGANCVSTLAPNAASYLVSNADVGHTLRVIVTASNGASSTASSAPTAVVTSTLQSPPGAQQPKITNVGISTRVLRGVAARRLSARIRYRLNEAGALTFTLQRGVGGVRRASRCFVARSKPARAKRCLAYVYLARANRAHQRAGDHRVTLASLFGRRQLAPGTYRVELTVRAPGGGKKTAFVSFQVR